MTLDPASGRQVTVVWATSVETGDTATSGTDFTAVPAATLTFTGRPDGEDAHGGDDRGLHRRGERDLHADAVGRVERDAAGPADRAGHDHRRRQARAAVRPVLGDDRGVGSGGGRPGAGPAGNRADRGALGGRRNVARHRGGRGGLRGEDGDGDVRARGHGTEVPDPGDQRHPGGRHREVPGHPAPGGRHAGDGRHVRARVHDRRPRRSEAVARRGDGRGRGIGGGHDHGLRRRGARGLRVLVRLRDPARHRGPGGAAG